MSNVIHFTPNIPLVLALKDIIAEPDGDFFWCYPTTDGRILRLPHGAAVRLNELEPQPGQTLSICRRYSGRPNEAGYWDIALTAETEQQKAAEEAPALEAQLSASVKMLGNRKLQSVPRKPVSPEQTRLFDRKGTGTNGPAPQPEILPAVHPAARPQPALPTRIPYNVAFAEVLSFVTGTLKAQGISWNDQAVQDTVSTILIAEAKKGTLIMWERAE